jgi:type I restriction enzyme M protein
VPASRLAGRLDAKHLLPWSVAELEPKWAAAGVQRAVLEDLVDPIEDTIGLSPNARYTFLRISYQGRCERGEDVLGREVSYSRIGRAQAGDIVVSNISAVYRAICVVPPGMEDLLVSNEFTVLRLKPGVDADPVYLWAVLRSSAVIAEWMSSSTGVGRHRVAWDQLRNQGVPLLPRKQQQEIGDHYRTAWDLEAQARDFETKAAALLTGLDLESKKAKERMSAAKPPK